MAHGVTEAEGQGTRSLSRGQRRELLQLAAAGCLSVIFFIVPIALVRYAPQAEAPLAEAPPQDPGPAPVRIVWTTVSAEASAPPLATAAPSAAATPRRTAITRQSRGRAAEPKIAMVRRIARLFAGDGRHGVQPFPTVASTDRSSGAGRGAVLQP